VGVPATWEGRDAFPVPLHYILHVLHWGCLFILCCSPRPTTFYRVECDACSHLRLPFGSAIISVILPYHHLRATCTTLGGDLPFRWECVGVHHLGLDRCHAMPPAAQITIAWAHHSDAVPGTAVATTTAILHCHHHHYHCFLPLFHDWSTTGCAATVGTWIPSTDHFVPFSRSSACLCIRVQVSCRLPCLRRLPALPTPVPQEEPGFCSTAVQQPAACWD